MSEQVVDAIAAATRSQNQKLEDVARGLVKLNSTNEGISRNLEQQTTALMQAIQELTAVQIETTLTTASTGITANQARLNEESASLEEQIQQHAAEVDAVEARVSNVLADIQKQTGEDLEAMDGPLLQLLDEFFTGFVHNRYQEILVPTQALLATAAHTAATSRQAVLTRAVDDVSQGLARAIDSIRSSISGLAKWALRSNGEHGAGDDGRPLFAARDVRPSEFRVAYVPVTVFSGHDGRRAQLRLARPSNAPDGRGYAFQGVADSAAVEFDGRWLYNETSDAERLLEESLEAAARNTTDKVNRKAAAMLLSAIQNGDVRVAAGVRRNG